MKKILAIIVMTCYSLTGLTQKNVTAELTHATVFLLGAELTHTAQITLSKGKQTITFDALAPQLNSESIVIECEDKTVTLLAVTPRVNYLKPVAANSRITVIKDSLTMLDNEMNLLSGKTSVLKSEKELLFKNESIGGTSAGVKVDEIAKAADFYRQRSLDLFEQIYALEKKHLELAAKRSKLQQALTELNAQYNPPTSEITVLLNVPNATTTTFAIKYVVADAGWAPKYDVRTSSIGDPISLTYRANVFNNCGIDWNNIQLTLSTSEPLRGAQKPTLETWNVMSELNANNAVVQTVQPIPGKYQDATGGVQTQQITIQELSAEFEIAEPYSILADAKPYIVDVNQFSLPATYEHYAVPKMEPAAYLTAKVVGWNELNIIPGKASVYFDGKYLGQSFIDPIGIDDTLRLSLGRDTRVSVVRKKLSEMNKKQVIGNNEKEVIYYQTTIKNNRDKPTEIIIEDQAPTSTSNTVIVDLLEYGDATYDKNSGKLIYHFTLQPGESKVIMLGYSIKRPRGTAYGKSKYRTIASPSF